MSPNKLIIVAGSPGAGKTSIVQSIKNNKKFKIVTVGTVMEEISTKMGLVKHRDEIRYLDLETMNRVRTKAFKEIGLMKGNIILDTHMTIEREGKHVPGLPALILSHLKNLVGIIYIDATTDEILERRRNDKTRKREMEDKEIIDMQRIVNVAMLAYCSIHLNISIYTIHNRENSIEKTIKEFKKALKDMTGS